MDELEKMMASRIAEGEAPAAKPDLVEQLLAQRAAGQDIPVVEEATSSRPWTDTLLSAAANAPSSVGKMIGGVADAVAHPVDTFKGVAALGSGAVGNAFPNFTKKITDFYGTGEQQKQAAQAASGFANTYKEGYGSVEGFKNKLAEDPASILGDLSTVFTGGAGAVGRAGMLGKALSKAGELTNPLSAIPLAAKGVSKAANFGGQAVSHALGSSMATGVGGQNFIDAFNAGKAGKATFIDNLMGRVNKEDVLDTASEGLHNMQAQKSAEYTKNMADVTGDKTILNFNGIDSAVQNATNRTVFNGKLVNKKAYEKVNEVKQAIDEWKTGDPNLFHTPEGLDKLKQRIGDIQQDIPFNETNARSAVGDIYKAVKNEVSQQAPTYAKAMGDYAESAQQIKEIKRALSLGENASADTAMRKLQSLTRNNVNSNYGNRADLAKALAEQGGADIMPALAGQALNSWTGRGMGAHIGQGAVGTLALLGHPGAIAMLPFQSPKLMGLASYGVGKAAGVPAQLAEKLSSRLPPSATEFISNNAGKATEFTAKHGNTAKALGLLLEQLQQRQ